MAGGRQGASAAAPGADAPTPSGARIWLMAARPRTLPAAVAPVLVGTALAGQQGAFHALRFAAALLSALFIQVGTNLSNDYSDARRGADTEDRLGPVRVTAGGLVPPRQVLSATYLTFGLAVLFGIYLTVVAGWQLLLVGAASILAGVLYTGGPRPYGYEGLGEVFVFTFFGIVAVAGSYFVQTRALHWQCFALSVPVGLLAAAILIVNNLRDIDTDRRAGKRTLAVRIGRARTRAAYALALTLPYVCVLAIALADRSRFGLWPLLCWATSPLAARLGRLVTRHPDGPTLNRALAGTGQLQLAFCALLSAGLLLGP
jgi:1,4-dihydroxy-2-naphthoate octaprenyltransferase